MSSTRPVPIRALVIGVLLAGLVGFAPRLGADHSWGPYHWARTANPFTLSLGDNLSSAWDPFLATSSADWSRSGSEWGVLYTRIVAGRSNPKNCRPTAGRIEACNHTYGNNGWLGVAQIWVTGGVHITQGTVRVNDTYFRTAKYNTVPWKNLVMCQEVGHTFGLDHQDETFNNAPLGTCMDYSNDPVPNQHPNYHDYWQLANLYAHVDPVSTVSNSSATSRMPPAIWYLDLEGPGQWGQLIRERRGGREHVYELDFGGGHKVITHVLWADEAGEGRGRGRDRDR